MRPVLYTLLQQLTADQRVLCYTAHTAPGRVLHIQMLQELLLRYIFL